MPTHQEDDQTPVDRDDRALSSQEAKDETQHYKTADRTYVNVLLHISEELFLKELEPFDYHCYSEWEDTVCGWARASPLSCILTNQKSYRKPKHKEADNLTLVDPTTPNVERSPSTAESHLKSPARLHSSKKSQPLNFQKQSWRQTGVADHQPHASECPGLSDTQRSSAHFSPGEKIDKETLRETPLQPWHQSSKYSLSESRHTNALKQNHKPNKILVPIKNITLLPPIKSLQLNPKISYHDCRGQKAPNGETFEMNVSMFDKKCGKKGTRVDMVAYSEVTNGASTSKCRTCQYNHYLLAAPSGTFPVRYQVPLSSKPDTVHRLRYSMRKNFHKQWLNPIYIPAACSSEQQDHMLSSSVMSMKYSIH